MTPFHTKIPPKDQWWSHYCRPQNDVMYFVKGYECDWCGMTEETIEHNKKFQEYQEKYMEWRNDERKTD